jgi:hypothetical protein
MVNWYDVFNLDKKTITDIQANIQTVDAMTTVQIKDFMAKATTVVADNLAKTGLVDFIDPNGEVMKWRVNTTTDVEEKLLSALDTIKSSDLKIRCSRESPGHLRDLVTKNIVAFLVDAFIGLPYQPTRTIQSIPTRGYQLSNNLNALWNKHDKTMDNTPIPIVDEISQPTFGKLRSYTSTRIGDIVSQIRPVIDDELTHIFQQYIDGTTSELSNINSTYIDDMIYKSYVTYMTKTRDTLMKAYTEMGHDATVISNYYDEVLPREIYASSSPISGTLSVSMIQHTGELEIIQTNGSMQIREKTIDYTYDNSAWFNRISRTMANVKYMISQGNQNAIAILAYASNAFMDIPDVFTSYGFASLNNTAINSFDNFVVEYTKFIATVGGSYYNIQAVYVGDVDISNNIIIVPSEPYTSGSDVILRFQYDIYKKTKGYVYLYDRTTRKSTLTEYREGLSDVDNTITSSNIFKFGLEDGSAIANTIVNISRAVDKTALTLSTLIKVGTQVASPVVLPGAYLVVLCEIVLKELWWKLGWDDLSTTFPFPPPVNCALSLLHPIYSTVALMKYPILATLNRIVITGIHIQQFLSKCIRDSLYVRLLQDNNTRFLGVNFLMTPVYSSTGIIEGTQMKRILNEKSYARLLALQILYFRYQECEQSINDFVRDMNATKITVQLKQTIRDGIVKSLSPAFLDILYNCMDAPRTDNYVKNAGLLSTPVSIQMNLIDLRFYETQSLAYHKNSVEGILRDYGIDTVVSEGDVANAIRNVQRQYENADTFQTRVYMTNTQATTNNGYFLRGLDMTDNGMLQNIKTEVNNYINQSDFVIGAHTFPHVIPMYLKN